MKFRDHWDRWGWLIPAAFLIIFFLRIVLGREAFCGSGEEQCLREWVSATAGWAAVPAAVVTVLYLSKQTRSAERHHRENIRLQIDFKYEIASGLIPITIDANQHIDDLILAAEQRDEIGFANSWNDIYETMYRVYISADAWDEFERNYVFATMYNLGDVRQSLKDLRDDPLPTNTSQFIGSDLESTLRKIRDYNSGVREAAEAFKKRVDSILDPS